MWGFSVGRPGADLSLSVLLLGVFLVAEVSSAELASPEVAAPRALLRSDVAGAIRVSGVPFPDDVIDGLYYPTSEMINHAIAYRKGEAVVNKPSNLWVARDPTGYWCIQPTGKKGTADAIMTSTSSHDARPEDAGTWQLWRRGQWQVQPAIHVRRPGQVEPVDPAGPAPPLGSSFSPAPAPLPRAFDNSPGVSILTPNHLVTDPADNNSWRPWAALGVGGIAIIALVECLINSENCAARSYISNVQSMTLTLIVGILVASQIVPFISFGTWRTSWSIELMMFIAGFYSLLWYTWKCQFSPLRRTVVWTFGGNFVGALGAAAFLDLREALFGWSCWQCDDTVLEALCLVALSSLLLAVMHSVAKWGLRAKMAHPPLAGWPAMKAGARTEALDIRREQAKHRQLRRNCFGTSPRAEESKTAVVEDTHDDYDWVIDALWAEHTATAIVMAFAVYNLLRAVANSFGDEWVGWSWTIIVLILFAVLFAVNTQIRKVRLRENQCLDRLDLQAARAQPGRSLGLGSDWETDVLIVSTLSRVLGLCIVCAMQKLQPGLRENLQDLFSISAVFATSLEVLGLTLAVVALIFLMSQVYDDGAESYGLLDLFRPGEEGWGPLGHCPQEVAGFSLALGLVWSGFISGLLGDFVEGLSFRHWIIPALVPGEDKNFVWFHAFLCMLMAGLIYLFWQRVILRRAVMRLEHHKETIEQERAYCGSSKLKNSFLE